MNRQSRMKLKPLTLRVEWTDWLLVLLVVSGLSFRTEALTLTGFGGVMAEGVHTDDYTMGVALLVLLGVEFEAGAVLSKNPDEVADWYGNVDFRFFAPERQFPVVLPYVAFGGGFLGETLTQNIGLGVNLGIVRADYRFIWDKAFREGHHRVYVGLEFTFGDYP